VFVTSSPQGCCGEVELHLHRTITPNYSGGYEFTCGIAPGSDYVAINRWPGPIGTQVSDYVNIGFRFGMGCVDGDVVGATAVGSTLTFYKNGVAVLSGSDTTYTGGAPGVGFFLQNNPGTISGWGFTNFGANDSGTLPALMPITQPTATLIPIAQPTATPTPRAQPTATPTPRAQPTSTHGPIATPTATLTQATNAGCTVQGTLNGVDTTFSRPTAFCSNQ
jgi:hypothetical protein